MKRLIPFFNLGRWSGPGERDETCFEGRSLVIEWGPFILEICIGKAT